MSRFRIPFRFSYLLLSLLLLVLVSPWAHVLRRNEERTGPVMALVFCALILAAVVALSEGRRSTVVAVLLAVVPLYLKLRELVVEKEAGVLAQWGILAFLVYTVVLGLRFLFTRRWVTFDTLCAALCVYLLLGVIWGIGYTLLDAYADGPAFRGGAPDGLPLGEGSAFYFSFVTLTTLGYGDITPVTPGARALALLEAIVGQFYLTVLVAALVGLLISRPEGRGAP